MLNFPVCSPPSEGPELRTTTLLTSRPRAPCTLAFSIFSLKQQTFSGAFVPGKEFAVESENLIVFSIFFIFCTYTYHKHTDMSSPYAHTHMHTHPCTKIHTDTQQPPLGFS